MYNLCVSSPVSLSSLNVKVDNFLEYDVIIVRYYRRPKYRFYFKTCLKELNPILKLCIVLIIQNNICLFDSQMQIENINLRVKLRSKQLSLVKSAVMIRWLVVLQRSQALLTFNFCILNLKDRSFPVACILPLINWL